MFTARNARARSHLLPALSAAAARTSFLPKGPALTAVDRHAARVKSVERDERRKKQRKQCSELCGRCGLRLGSVCERACGGG